MGSPLKLDGQRFGRLLVKSRGGKVKNHYTWDCICDCGKETNVMGSSLMYGNTKSCGCLQRESAQALAKEDAKYKHPLYGVYNDIKKRCYNENCAAFKNYGGRGIEMCKEWLESFEQFVADVGARPFEEFTLERKNNSGNYSPDNIEWASKATQARNQRMYENNTSGMTGVNLINKKRYPCWLARVPNPNGGKEFTKAFSISKLGNDEAFRLACEYREYLLKWVNEEFNAGYSDSHGK